MTTKARATPAVRPMAFLDRDHSILAFNERVLDWAHRPDVPLLERLRYLCIVSSNLDEFFEVRMADHLQAWQSDIRKGVYTAQSFEALALAAHTLVDRQYALYNDAFMPAFGREGIEIIGFGDRTPAQPRWVRHHFEREVRPLLIPVGLDPSHPFPQVANKTLNFIVRLGGKDAFGRENDIAIVKIPRVLPRLIRMPDKVSGGKAAFVSLSSVIRAHLPSLFPGRDVGQFSQFRVTRHSDLAVDDAAYPQRPRSPAGGGVGRDARLVGHRQHPWRSGWLHHTNLRGAGGRGGAADRQAGCGGVLRAGSRGAGVHRPRLARRSVPPRGF